MTYFVIILFLIYVVYTFIFAVKFNKTDKIFTDRQRLYHNIFIWLIPFFWIMVIKTLTKPTPGSTNFRKTTRNAGFYESGIGIWGDSDFRYDEGGGDGLADGAGDGGDD